MRGFHVWAGGLDSQRCACHGCILCSPPSHDADNLSSPRLPDKSSGSLNNKWNPHAPVFTPPQAILPDPPASGADSQPVGEPEEGPIGPGGMPLMRPDIVRRLLLDLFLGVEYLHSLSIVHRDLKPGTRAL